MSFGERFDFFQRVFVSLDDLLNVLRDLVNTYFSVELSEAKVVADVLLCLITFKGDFADQFSCQFSDSYVMYKRLDYAVQRVQTLF